MNVSISTGAKFLGVVIPSTEYSYVKHGIHDSIEDVITYIKYLVENGRKIGINKFLIINCHGGNTIILDELSKLNSKDCFIKMESVCLTHASTEEVSLGYAVGILSEDNMKTHDPKIYEEIGMVGLKEAREKNEAIDLEAKSVEKNGVFLDKTHGKSLLNDLITNYVEIVRNMI